MKLVKLGAVGLVCVLAGVGYSQTAVDRANAVGRPVLKGQKVVAHPDRVYHGLYNIGDVPEEYAEMTEESLGLNPGVVFTFHDWNRAGLEAEVPVLGTFNDPMEGDDRSVLEFAQEIAQDGAVLAIAWDPITYLVEHPEFDYLPGGPNTPITYADVFSGMYDGYIRTCANQVKDFGKPIMLSVTGEYNSVGFVSFGAEGNEYVATVVDGDLTGHYGDPLVPDGPERVRDLYRYVIDIFNEEGVENVTWFMYSQTAYMNRDEFDDGDEITLDALHPRHYYPGDEYIDWLGNSAYVSNDDPVWDLEYAIGVVIGLYREMGVEKPWFLPEFAVMEMGEDSRAKRIAALLLSELPNFPEVKMFAFADGPLFEGYFDIPDLGSGKGELDAWNTALHKSGLFTNRIRSK